MAVFLQCHLCVRRLKMIASADPTIVVAAAMLNVRIVSAHGRLLLPAE